MIRRLLDLLGPKEKAPEEASLERQVRAERRKLEDKQRRVDRVLEDFYRADKSIRGSYRGPGSG